MGLFKTLFKMTPVGAVYWSIRDAKREGKEARNQMSAAIAQVQQQRSLLEKSLAESTAATQKRRRNRTSSPFSRSLLQSEERTVQSSDLRQTLGA